MNRGNCDAPVDVCINIDEAADYEMEDNRHNAREATLEEAMGFETGTASREPERSPALNPSMSLLMTSIPLYSSPCWTPSNATLGPSIAPSFILTVTGIEVPSGYSVTLNFRVRILK